MAKHGEHPDLPSELEELLEEDVHTIFLKADCPPRVKRGTIGNLKLIELEVNEHEWDNLRLESLQESLQTVVEANQDRSDCFLEIDRKGCQVLQLGDLRITCASPPFSDAREITVVRPVAKLSLSDYNLDPKIVERLSNHHRGVFICGRPGSAIWGASRYEKTLQFSGIKNGGTLNILAFVVVTAGLTYWCIYFYDFPLVGSIVGSIGTNAYIWWTFAMLEPGSPSL